jgi:hypothetical protein
MRNLVFKVASKRRSVPRHWWTQLVGPRPETSFACDGCSNSPDDWRRFMIWPACVIHDFHYRTGILGGTWQSRQAADKIFRHNVVKLIALQGGCACTGQVLAWVYWGRVRIWGRSSYRHWDDPKAALPFFRRVLEAWGFRKD